MYLQEIVEVAIGLVFAWLLLSLAVLQIQEIIARLTQKRSNDLYDAIGRMLEDPQALQDFYDHPLIKGLKTPPKGVRDWFKKNVFKKELTLKNPSYIPAKTFATALFDVVTKAGTEESPITTKFSELRTLVESLKAGDQETANKLISYLIDLGQTHASTQIEKLKGELRKEMLIKLTELEKVGEDEHGNKPLESISKELRDYVNGNRADEIAGLLKYAEPYLDQVRKGATKNVSENLGKALESLLAGAEEYATNTDKAIALARKNVEEWFDSSMERLSGLYKRWAQAWAFVIALVIAIAFNVDSIHIADELWHNPTLRQASTAYIDNFVQEKTKEGAALTETDLQKLNGDLKDLNFPVGWGELPAKGERTLWPFWALALVGWIITAGAAMQGAPFWFDTLKKLVNIRSSGANPVEKSKEETAK